MLVRLRLTKKSVNLNGRHPNVVNAYNLLFFTECGGVFKVGFGKITGFDYKNLKELSTSFFGDMYGSFLIYLISRVEEVYLKIRNS